MGTYDLVIIGAGPGGLAAGIRAKELGLSHVIIEKGSNICQGIIDSYPKGKRVYPTIPKEAAGPFPIQDLEPSHEPVEQYLAKVGTCIEKRNVSVRLGEEFQDVVKEDKAFKVLTKQNQYRASNVVLAFGRNIPADLGVYGDAKMVARRLASPEDHIGASTLVFGGGNAAADVVAALSSAKRASKDDAPVYWAHRREQFRIDKAVARDLGEEVLLGGNIRILQGAVPVIGEVDEDGVDRLLIRVRDIDVDHGLKLHQGMSFPMKHVIACIGTQGPAAVFDKLGLQLITASEVGSKAGKEGSKLVMLKPWLETSITGIYAIGAAISPTYGLLQEDATIKRHKHTDVIFTAVKDGVTAVEHIARWMSKA